MSRLTATALLSLLTLCSTNLLAYQGSRIIATGGSMSIEGSAGGGLVPWATLAGYADDQELGGAAYVTQVYLPDYSMRSYGMAASLNNRIELSVAEQQFDTRSGSNEPLGQTIIGAKLRLYGELMYTRLPQLSAGVQLKQHNGNFSPSTLGATDSNGVDFFLSASKLRLAGLFNHSTFFNATVRATRANQLGLMGFGGDKNNAYKLQAELSTGLFLNRHWVVGAEYRQKPDNLSAAQEDDWYDAFVGWFPNKRVAIVAAWSQLGSIDRQADQRSLYLSLQISH